MNRFIIKTLLAIAFIAVVSVSGCRQPSKESEKTTVGAIRWDGWVGEKGSWQIGPIVERTLGPERFHYRAPFFSKVLGKDSISIDGTSQEIMDMEIAYAKDAGIDYWAYCWYPDGCGLELARKLHQTSKFTNDVKWCAILGAAIAADSAGDFSKSLVLDFAKENYQKVLDGRPLVYLLHGSKISKAEIDRMRTLCIENNLKNPYVVAMEWSADLAVDYCERIGADAISCYATLGKDNRPFAEIIPQKSIALWESYSTKKPVVPWVCTGWNARPRMESPNPWTQYYSDSTNCQDATAEEIADFLLTAIDWTQSNRDAAAANTVLMYAWNEHDEGYGSICPTLGKDGKPDTERIDAIKLTLKNKNK